MVGCKQPGCDATKHHCRGYCLLHWGRWYHGRPMEGGNRRDGTIRCDVAGCSRPRKGGGLGKCRMHYERTRRGSKNAHIAFNMNRRQTKSVGRVQVSKITFKYISNMAEHTGRSVEMMTAAILDAWSKQRTKRGGTETTREIDTWASSDWSVQEVAM